MRCSVSLLSLDRPLLTKYGLTSFEGKIRLMSCSGNEVVNLNRFSTYFLSFFAIPIYWIAFLTVGGVSTVQLDRKGSSIMHQWTPDGRTDDV